MDLSQKARELEIDESLYVSLLETFEKHLAVDLSAVEHAVTESDFAALHAAAHSIKGASGSLSLWPIYDAASEICTIARDELAVPVDRHVSIIRIESEKLSRLLHGEATDSADGT